ncbi:heme-binding protein [Caballeronia sp. LZ034LL]|uniref:GlcG/HbpS family heme-binding protein n=1 Tax=Caballeronia sp. LZ034LL TaxID=3038567 RepID=UPI002855A3A0|nr:heme-binding protein [Caballeronia sp. LZ034LL]MDR5837571.1 heme-binding protein [Caballeronia sp. LZ034LL]
MQRLVADGHTAVVEQTSPLTDHAVAAIVQQQDGAPLGTIELAIGKAMSAVLFARSTAELATFAQPGGPFYGIQQTHAGKVVIFGGGVPVFDGAAIVGAVGASAGMIEQDIEVADAGLTAFGHSLA